MTNWFSKTQAVINLCYDRAPRNHAFAGKVLDFLLLEM